MKYSETKIRVRYGETDQMGIVYHGNYAQYLEMGRIDWLRNLGISYKKMEEQGVMLPVISLSLNYKKSACYDDLIYVRTKLSKMPTASIEFDFEILNEDGEIITLAKTVLAFINMKTMKPIRCPNYILDKLQN
ncbi:MAG: acyl-CoA thioesterase [Flavobacteriaceae bacterium]|nr:acyl-CoA thioesterase [Flavobacteriaceae bacterium]